jgi:hypothetical protein
MTFATPAVQIRLQFAATLLVILDLPKVLPLGTKRFGKRIGEANRDKLRQTRFIAMRQVAALIPTAKALLEDSHLRRRRPTSLAFD